MLVPSRRNNDQSGAALIEFALVLPLLLAIAVGIIYYGYAFVLQAAVEHAAKNGAQAAVAVSPLSEDYSSENSGYVRSARDAVRGSLAWLPESVDTQISNDENVQVFEGAAGEDAVCPGAYGVTVKLPLATVLPQFSLGGFNIPPLGADGSTPAPTIKSTACVTL